QIWDLARIQRELAALALDWISASHTEQRGITDSLGTASSRANAPTLSPNTPTATRTFYVMAVLGVIVAVFVGLYTLRYHQRMMDSYEEVELLVARRNLELERAQAELLHSQKMKALGTLAAGIAHDFNNLLSVIRMGNNLA